MKEGSRLHASAEEGAIPACRLDGESEMTKRAAMSQADLNLCNGPPPHTNLWTTFLENKGWGKVEFWCVCVRGRGGAVIFEPISEF